MRWHGEPQYLAKNYKTAKESSSGFPPVTRADAQVLILGSLPSQRSLLAGEYYAHPQNAFWKIMHALTGASGSYDERCAALVAQRIALWDVLAESVRPGSMDADIALDTAKVNDFKGFFSRHQQLHKVCFNGRKAAEVFQRFVSLDESVAPRHFETLPSTSPAYAAMPYEEKLRLWRTVLT